MSLNRRVESDLVPHASSSLLYLRRESHADNDLDPILHLSPPGVGGSASATDSLVASEDALVLAKEPCALRPAAGKDP